MNPNSYVIGLSHKKALAAHRSAIRDFLIFELSQNRHFDEHWEEKSV